MCNLSCFDACAADNGGHSIDFWLHEYSRMSQEGDARIELQLEEVTQFQFHLITTLFSYHLHGSCFKFLSCYFKIHHV